MSNNFFNKQTCTCNKDRYIKLIEMPILFCLVFMCILIGIKKPKPRNNSIIIFVMRYIFTKKI